MEKDELKALIKSNVDTIDKGLKNIAKNVLESKKDTKTKWVSLLITIITLVVGVVLGQMANQVGHYFNDPYVEKTMLDEMSIEIQFNQTPLFDLPTEVTGYLQKIQMGQKDNPAWVFGVQDKIFNSYLNQMDLLDENTRTDITLLYEQFYGQENTCELLQQVSNDYYLGLSFVTKQEVNDQGSECITTSEGTAFEADIVLAELVVTDHANPSQSFVDETYISKIQPQVEAYEKTLAPGATTSLPTLSKLVGDPNGFGTAVILLRDGEKIVHPISNLEFQK